jgi:hypothetical protein
MIRTPAVIRTELMEHTDGRPVAYIDATSMVVFSYQEPDGTYIVDICTRNDSGDRLCVLLDGLPLNRTRKAMAAKACLHWLCTRADPHHARGTGRP